MTGIGRLLTSKLRIMRNLIGRIFKRKDDSVGYKFNLTIRAIVKWELMNHKPFSDMNYGDENDIVSLFYVCHQLDEVDIPLLEFKEELSDDSIRKMIADFEKQTTIDSQFKCVRRQETGDRRQETGEDCKKDSSPVYIKDTVALLVMNGLDVNFALDRMKLYEIPVFAAGFEQKQRGIQETARFWTYLLLSPHLSKKTKSPKDLCPFEWEIKEMKEKAAKDIEEGEDVFNAFMNWGKEVN